MAVMQGFHVHWRKKNKVNWYAYVLARDFEDAYEQVSAVTGRMVLFFVVRGFDVAIRSGTAARAGVLYAYREVRSAPRRKPKRQMLLPFEDKGMRFFCFEWESRNYFWTKGVAVVVHETQTDAYELLRRTILLQGDMDRYNDVLSAKPAVRVHVPIPDKQEFEMPGVFYLQF